MAAHLKISQTTTPKDQHSLDSASKGVRNENGKLARRMKLKLEKQHNKHPPEKIFISAVNVSTASQRKDNLMRSLSTKWFVPGSKRLAYSRREAGVF